jgi:galactose-1-phosphate uridylyltransferase
MKGAIKKKQREKFKSKPKKMKLKVCDKWALGKKKGERTQVQAKRIEPKMHHKQASKQSCFNPPPITINISKREKDEKLEKAKNLKNP